MIEIELVQRRLRVRSAIAAAVRRATGMEMLAGGGYLALPKRKVRMEQIAKVPKDIDRLHLLWVTDRGDQAVVELLSGERVRYAVLPLVALQRYARQMGRRRNG